MIGLGTWKSDLSTMVKVVDSAISSGYRHIDCAAVYGNECQVGQALQHSLSHSAVERQDLWITSKLWNDNQKAEHVRPACLSTLADLQLDYLDLYVIHWPIAFRHGVRSPASREDFVPRNELALKETWLAMEALQKEGLVKNIGVSNFNISHLKEIMSVASVVPSVNQVESHPYLQQRELLGFCQQQGIHMTAYSPLGSSGRSAELRSADERMILEDATIQRIAARRGASSAQVLLAWQIQRGVSVIPKSSSPTRLAENLAAALLELTEQDNSEIAAINIVQRYFSLSSWFGAESPYSLSDVWG